MVTLDKLTHTPLTWGLNQVIIRTYPRENLLTKTKLMDAATEIELVRAAHGGDKRALDKLVLANTGLVHKIVHKFPMKNASVGYDDLYQEGIAGLIHGIRKFESDRGYRLSTYCYRWIQAYVMRYYQNHGRSIRLPVHMATKQWSFHKQVEQLTQELGRTPTAEEINALGDNVELIQSSLMNVASLNALINESDEMECLQGEDKTEEHDYEMECDLLLTKLREEVSPRDYDILVCRYGLEGKPPHTLSELADKHGVTRARVHQVNHDLLRLMRKMVASTETE